MRISKWPQKPWNSAYLHSSSKKYTQNYSEIPRHTYRNPHCPVLGRLEDAQNSAAPRETVWQFLIELKTHHATQQTSSWILTKRNKSAYLHTHTNYIRNCSQLWSYCEKLETTQMSISWWADKLLSEMEKQGTDETPATQRNLGDTALGERSRLRKTPCLQWLRLHAPSAGGTGLIPGQGTKIPRATQWGQKKKKTKKEDPILHDSIYMTFWKRQNYRGIKTRTYCTAQGTTIFNIL